MGTTNILDLNNRVDEMEKSYPASQVMLSDGVTSAEEAVGSKSTVMVKDVTITLTPGYLGGTINVSTGISPNKILSLYLIYSDDVFYLLKTDKMVGFIYSITADGEIIMISPPDKTLGSIAAQRTLNFRVAYLM